MKKMIILLLPLAGTLFVGSGSMAMGKKSYADATKTVPSTTIVQIITVQSSTYHLEAALKRKRKFPSKAFELYKNELAQTWAKNKNGTWSMCQGPTKKQTAADSETVKASYAQQAAAVLSKLIDPLHAKHSEYAKRTGYKEEIQESSGKLVEGYFWNSLQD